MNTIYADMRVITPEQERDILVKNALSAMGTARQRNDHLFNENGWIPQRKKKESIMTVARNYVRSEWKYWVMAIVGLFLWAAAGAAAAVPVVKHHVNGVKFVQDTEAKKWFTIYKGKSNNLDDRFTDLRIVWKGKLKDEPLLLVAGKREECESDFLLLWFKKDGNSEMVNQFPACSATFVQIHPGYPVTRVEIDGQSALIDWEDHLDGGERRDALVKAETKETDEPPAQIK